MRDCQIALLPDRGVISLTGEDTKNFLQGLITNDIDKAEDRNAIHSALLTPQGKILFDFFVLVSDRGYLLETSKVQIPDFVKRLTFYKLRADVQIEDLNKEYTVLAAWGTDADLPGKHATYRDPRLSDLGIRLIVENDDTSSVMGKCSEASRDDYHAYRISLGVPEGGLDFEYGDTFLHEGLLDQLNGVDFNKGCFVGQEVVSRMHHRANIRKRIVPVQGDVDLPATGTEITADGLAIGRLGSVAGRNGLAMIRLDRAGKALQTGEKISATGVSLTLKQPKWASFDVPQRQYD